jgi:dihydropteroate synthase
MFSELNKPVAWRCGRFYFDWQKDPRPLVMGVLNVTPDSFSDGGLFIEPTKALDHAFQMIEDGAQIIDIGGESTKPGVAPTSAQEEQDRVLPIIEKLQSAGVAISIDTYKAQTMKLALEIGVDILNDIQGFQDPHKVAIAASSKDVGLCIMHMQNQPHNMQDQPHYDNLIGEISQFLKGTVNHLSTQGITSDRVAIDPGFGFGKTTEHNLSLLHRLDQIERSGIALLVGLSRKKTLARILGSMTADRTIASVAAALLAVERGANVVRVHDVKPTVEAIKVWTAMHLESLDTTHTKINQ